MWVDGGVMNCRELWLTGNAWYGFYCPDQYRSWVSFENNSLSFHSPKISLSSLDVGSQTLWKFDSRCIAPLADNRGCRSDSGTNIVILTRRMAKFQ